MRTRTIALSLLALVAASPAFAAEPSLSDIKFGEHVCGDQWTQEDLKGRVVLAYYWNIG